MAIYVPCRWVPYHPLGFRYSLLLATGPNQSERLHRAGEVHRCGTYARQQRWCTEHAFQEGAGTGSACGYQVLDCVLHGVLDDDCQWSGKYNPPLNWRCTTICVSRCSTRIGANFYQVSTFIPIIIASFGFSTLNSLLLVMPAGAIIGTVELVAPYLAYKYPGNRTWIIVVCQCGTILGSLLLWLLPQGSTGGLLFACYVLACFGGAYGVLMGVQTANTAGYTKKSVTASGIFLGYCLGRCSSSDIKLLFH